MARWRQVDGPFPEHSEWVGPWPEAPASFPMVEGNRPAEPSDTQPIDDPDEQDHPAAPWQQVR